MNKKPDREKVAREAGVDANMKIDALRELFPEAFTEGKIDWEKLRLTLGEEVDERPERYNFTWAGKRDSIRILQTPSRATLVPVKDESVNWETTKNLFIEGDNLEVLKLMLKPYFGRVKMIYIDPPYNTGNDFVYPDNYADPLSTYLKFTGQRDSNGDIQTSNLETNGRYHSVWLSMMYPRLFLARQLLRDDGVLFVTIGDQEAHNLRMILNEIFGEESFVANIVWQKKQSPQNDSIYISDMHDHILVYAKHTKSFREDPNGWQIHLIPRGDEQEMRYGNPDNDPRGAWTSVDYTCNKTADERPNLFYPIINPTTGKEVWPSRQRVWRFGKSENDRNIKENRIWWGKGENGMPRLKRFRSEVAEGIIPSTWWDRETSGDNQEARRELRGFFGEMEDAFDTPKPVRLMRRMLMISGTDEPCTILDFFSGSCSTAQAVLESNHEDGGSRHFIMVQLPEPSGNTELTTIADIGKERIRRVIKKLSQENGSKLNLSTRETPEDLGFRVFKLAESNYKPWVGVEDKDPDKYVDQLEAFVDPLVIGWQADNVIYEVAIKEGYGLNITISEAENTANNKILTVTDPDKGQSFRICLDETLDKDTPRELKLRKDDLFICRDSALTDELAANLALQCKLKTI